VLGKEGYISCVGGWVACCGDEMSVWQSEEALNCQLILQSVIGGLHYVPLRGLSSGVRGCPTS
jgi:hypothetical protein